MDRNWLAVITETLIDSGTAISRLLNDLSLIFFICQLCFPLLEPFSVWLVLSMAWWLWASLSLFLTTCREEDFSSQWNKGPGIQSLWLGVAWLGSHVQAQPIIMNWSMWLVKPMFQRIFPGTISPKSCLRAGRGAPWKWGCSCWKREPRLKQWISASLCHWVGGLWIFR